MASMYPKTLPAQIRGDRQRRAECNVYDALQAQLADDPEMHVFYSRDWLNQLLKSTQKDGECDFIVAHPELGILFIEVKGGRVRRDGRENRWFSYDGHREHEIKDPVRQARTSKHVILAELERHWDGEMPFVWLVHCVILPDSAPNTEYFGAGMPAEIFCFMDDMPKLARWIYRMFDFNENNESRYASKPGPEGIRILEQMFAKDLDFSPRLEHTIPRDELEIRRLTEDQKKFLDVAELMPRVLFEGPAGSGKTVLAIRFAESEAYADKSGRVLFTCFNRGLSVFLKKTIQEKPANLEILTFHSLCKNLVLEAGILSQHDIDSDEGRFRKNVVGHTVEAIGLIKPSYAAIVVDEAQDFEEEWWEIIEFLKGENEHCRIRVFRDDNQLIRGHRPPDFVKLEGPLRLNRVIRNTRMIGEASACFYRGPAFTVEGPMGDVPSWLPISRKEVQRVEELILRFIDYEGIKTRNIAVLTFSALNESPFKDVRELAGHKVYRSEKLGDGLVLDSIFRFKGLECDVAILCGFEGRMPSDNELYTGISRARSHLAVVASPRVLSSLQSTVDSPG